MKRLIRQILKEETENKNINSIVEMIRALFNDVVVDIEVGEIRKKPLIRVQIKTDDPAVNIDNWYAQQMVDIISDYTGGDFKLIPWWSPLRRDEVFDAYIDVYRKRYGDEGNTLKEDIKLIDQPYEDLDQYRELFDSVIYNVIGEDDLCGYSLEYFLFYDEPTIRFILNYKKRKLTYKNLDKQIEKHRELASILKTFVPVVDKYIVAYDTVKCNDNINENYSPAGKEITPNKIIVHKSNPSNRNKILEQGLKVRSGECYKTYAGYGEKCIPAIFATNTTNKRAWFDSTYDDDIWYIDTTMIPDVKWFKDRHFESSKKHIVTFQDIPSEALTLFYEGSGKSDYVMKESKDETNYLPIIKKIVEPFKNEDCVCDISVWYDEEDDMYSVYLVLGNEELNDKFYYVDGIRTYRNNLANKIKTEIKAYLPIDNLYVGSYGKPNCGWKPLNESKDDIQKNLSAIRDMLKTISWDGLCDIWVEYNKDDGDYEIRSKTTNRDREFDEDLSFLDRTLRSIGLRVFIFAPWFVENCEDEVEFLD